MAAGVRVTVYAALAVAEAKRLSVEGRAKIAHQAAGDARATAPVETGEYRSGVGVEVGGSRVAIVNNDPEAGYKEYGTSDTPAHMTMTNAARKYGRYSGMT
jgi:hypothetical protein